MNKTNKTALIVLNLQNQFTDEKGCLCYGATKAAMPVILEGIRKLREHGVFIVFANAEADGEEEILDTELLKRRDPVPLKGSWEAEMNPDVEVLPGDLVMTHYASSAFFGTDLEKELKNRNIVNVIVCGVKTNYDVRATATDAMWRKFQAFAAAEMVACDTEELSKLHLEELTKYTAKALTLQEILRRIEEGNM